MSTTRSRNPRRTSGSGGRTPFLLLFGIALVVLIAILAFLGGGGGGSEYAAAATTGDTLPAASGESTTDSAVGLTPPAFTAEDLEGGEVGFAPGEDGPAAVVFLAHWCPHCQNEAPVLQQVVDEGVFEEAGVELVPVTTGMDAQRENYPPEDWFDELGWSTPVAVDGDGALAEAYGLAGYPYWVFVDADGQVIGRVSGELGADAIRTAVQQLGAAA